TTLSGIGRGTIIELDDIDDDINMITSGGYVTIRDMVLDGRKDLNTSGDQRGTQFSDYGRTTLQNLEVRNFRNAGIDITQEFGSIVVDNYVHSNGIGIMLYGLSDVLVANNQVSNNTTAGIYMVSSSNNKISGNRIINNGDSTNNDGIVLEDSSFNHISDNEITDFNCSSDCYAINITDSDSEGNYLSGNLINSGATINDQGTDTIYAGQIDGSG